MNNNTDYDAIVVGGSSAGLSAALALGRALRKVLVIDSGSPCNRKAPHSHNFFTRDGASPAELLLIAKEQLNRYKTVEVISGLVTRVEKNSLGFLVSSESGAFWKSKKIIFATGIKDVMPSIPGFKEAWGISIIHCPYCHGFEYHGQETGLLASGQGAYDMGKLLFNWTSALTIYTNGEEELTEPQRKKLSEKGIQIDNRKIKALVQENGILSEIHFEQGSSASVKVLYAHPKFEQHCTIPLDLGCELTEHGHIKVEPSMETTVEGVYACGDNTTFIRSIANAVFNGTMAGGSVNAELINAEFE